MFGNQQEHQFAAVRREYGQAVRDGNEARALHIKSANPDVITPAWEDILRNGGNPI